MECLVCYTSDDEPKRLSCEHTVCVRCADQILNTSEIRHEVQCPLCLQVTHIPDGDVSSLPTNLLQQKLQQPSSDYSPLHDALFQCQFCMVTKSVFDIKYCRDCNWDICVTCVVRHTCHPVFNKHYIDEKSLIVCKNHNKQFNFYCTDCEKFLCAVCINNDVVCENHTIRPLKELKTLKIEEATSLMELIEERQRPITKVKEKLEELLQTKRAINDHVFQLKTSIDIRRDQLLETFEPLEAELQNILTDWQIKNLDQEMVKELFKSLDEGIENGIEKTIIASEIIRSKTPTTSMISPHLLDTTVYFQKKTSLSIGHIIIKKHQSKYNVWKYMKLLSVLIILIIIFQEIILWIKREL